MQRVHIRNFSKGFSNAFKGGPELRESARALINLDPFHEVGTVKVRPRHRATNSQLTGVGNIFWQREFDSSGLMARAGGTIFDDKRTILGGALSVDTQFLPYNEWILIVRNGERPRKYKRGGVKGSFRGTYMHPWEGQYIPNRGYPWALRGYSGASSTIVYEATNEWEIEQVEGSTPATVGHTFVTSLVEAKNTSYYEACALLNEAVFVGLKAPEYSLDKEYMGSYTQSWEQQYVPIEITKSFKFGAKFSSLEATAISGYIRSNGMDIRGFACSFAWEDFHIRGSEQLQTFEVGDAVTSAFDLHRYLYAANNDADNSLSGTYSYAVTFRNEAGFESNYYSLGSVTVTSGYIQISNLPVSNDPQVVERRVYRTKTGGTTYYLRSIIEGNFDEPSFIDSKDDTYLSDYTAVHSGDHEAPLDNIVWATENKSRLFLLDAQGNIWWANSNVDWEYFSSNNYEPLYTGDASPKRLESLYDELHAFFEDRVVGFYGASEEDFRVADLPIPYGLPSARGLYNYRDRLFFADAEGMIKLGRSQEGFGAILISEAFDLVFAGRSSGTWELNTAQVSKLVMGLSRDELYLSYPGGTNTSNSHTLVLNLRLNAARQINTGFLDFTWDPVNKDLYGVASDGLIYKLDRSYTSGSVDIELESYEEDGDDPAKLKRCGKVWVDVNTGGQQFTFAALLDGTERLSESLRTTERATKSFDIGVDTLARRIRFKLTGTDIDASFKLYNISFEFEPTERAV